MCRLIITARLAGVASSRCFSHAAIVTCLASIATTSATSIPKTGAAVASSVAGSCTTTLGRTCKVTSICIALSGVTDLCHQDHQKDEKKEPSSSSSASSSSSTSSSSSSSSSTSTSSSSSESSLAACIPSRSAKIRLTSGRLRSAPG